MVAILGNLEHGCIWYQMRTNLHVVILLEVCSHVDCIYGSLHFRMKIVFCGMNPLHWYGIGCGCYLHSIGEGDVN